MGMHSCRPQIFHHADKCPKRAGDMSLRYQFDNAVALTWSFVINGVIQILRRNYAENLIVCGALYKNHCQIEACMHDVKLKRQKPC